MSNHILHRIYIASAKEMPEYLKAAETIDLAPASMKICAMSRSS